MIPFCHLDVQGVEPPPPGGHADTARAPAGARPIEFLQRSSARILTLVAGALRLKTFVGRHMHAHIRKLCEIETHHMGRGEIL